MAEGPADDMQVTCGPLSYLIQPAKLEAIILIVGPFRLQHSLTPPNPKLSSELQWPVQPNLNTSSTLFFVGLFQAASFHPKYDSAVMQLDCSH